MNKVVELVSTRPVFKVVVDYNQSLAEMIENGHYHWVNYNVIQRNFPVKREGVHEQEQEITLFHFKRKMNSDDVLAEMEKAGYRPATLPELLALGAAHLDIQKRFPIICLGSTWQYLKNGRFYVPSLRWQGSSRYLKLDWIEPIWHRFSRFASVQQISVVPRNPF